MSGAPPVPSLPGGPGAFQTSWQRVTRKMLVFALEKQPLRGTFRHRYLRSLRNESHMHTTLKSQQPRADP